MAQKLIGVVVSAPDSPGIVAGIEHAEQLGIPAAWMTTDAGARSVNTNGTSVLVSALPVASVRRSSQISFCGLA